MNILGAIFPIEQFFDGNTSLVDRLQSRLPFVRTCLLRGDADQCFRSLLFQASLSYASIGKRIVFYTPLPLQTIPLLVHNRTSNSISSIQLHCIDFYYLSTLSDVHNHLVQLISSPPDVIIVEGYLEYPLYKSDDLFKIVAACAQLRDTHEYLMEKMKKKNLILLCSCTCAETWMANVEQRALFDLAMDIEMLEDGDYHARIQKENTSITFDFRIGYNEIMPLSATIN